MIGKSRSSTSRSRRPRRRREPSARTAPMADGIRSMNRSGSRGLASRLAVFLLALAAPPARAQEPEVIVLDPNRPLIQSPGPVPAPAVASPAPSEETAVPVASPLQEGVNAREVLADLWFKERALAGRGDTAEAARQVETALDFMRREGLRGAPEIAGAFLAEARRYLDDGDYRGAQENFRLASRFDPALAASHFGLAVVLLRGDRDLSGALGELWTALKVRMADVGSVYQQAGNGLIIVYVGLCFGVAAALFLICLHVAPAFSHDVMERFQGKLSDESARLIGWGLMAVPVPVVAPVVLLLAGLAGVVYSCFHQAGEVVALPKPLLLLGS